MAGARGSSGAAGRLGRITPGVAGTIVFVAGLAALAVVASVQYTATPDCSLQHPCTPDPLGSALGSGLLTLPFLGWVQLRLAAITAVALEVVNGWHDVLHPAQALLATHLALVPVAAGCVVLGWRVRAGPPRHRPERAQFVRAGVLLAIGVALIGVTVHRQVSADNQTRSARVVTVTVTGRVDSAVVVDQAGTRWRVEVIDPAVYPVGSRQLLAVDDAGLRQLFSEPYDATVLLVPAVFAVLIGAGSLWRLRSAAAAAGPDARVADRATSADGWPAPGPELLLIGVAPVLGLIYWKPVMNWVVAVACGTGDCRPLPLSLIGWGIIGVPILVLAAVVTLARPGVAAMWALLVTLSLLCLGFAALTGAEETFGGPSQQDFFRLHPGSSSALPGSGFAEGALVLGAFVGGTLRGSSWLRFGRTYSALPLVVLAGCELIVLPAAIWSGR